MGGQPIEIVERETSFAGRGETGIEIGGKNIGFTVGVDAIINDGHLTNFWGPQIGIGRKMVNNFKFLLSIQFFMTETIKDMESFS